MCIHVSGSDRTRIFPSVPGISYDCIYMCVLYLFVFACMYMHMCMHERKPVPFEKHTALHCNITLQHTAALPEIFSIEE